MSVGIVVVSHSAALAEAAWALAGQMVPAGAVRVALAAGTADGGIGTDAARVASAIEEVASPDGVLVLTDLGSAILSAETALEFIDLPGVDVRISGAPFVEGMLAAVVSAGGGLGLDAVAAEAAAALRPKQEHLGAEAPATPATPPAAEAAAAGASEASAELELINRDGLHVRPAALVVAALAGKHASLAVARADGTLVPVTGPTALLGLGARQGDRVRFVATGADAEAVIERVTALVEDGFGESTEPAPQAAPEPVRPAGQPLGVSGGRVAGPVARWGAPIAPPAEGAPLAEDQREAEAARIAPASATAAAQVQARAERATQPEARAILEATVGLIADPGLLDEARARVRDAGISAEGAIWAVFGEAASALAAQGGRAAARAADLEDARARIVAALTGRDAPGLPALAAPSVLVAKDLAPADTALLDPAMCLALVTEEGGPTSHTAIIARALGIPAVVGASDAWTSPRGTTLLVDGDTGEIVWDPDAAALATVRAREEAPAFSGHGATSDAYAVPLLANVGAPADAAAAAAAGAQGVGLFRTEFCFLDREDAPTIDEQVAAYRGVLAAFPGRKVVVRTLDAGADKPLPFLTPAHEDNPALGVRGYRTSWAHPDVLDGQLAAIARAATAESAHVAVMAPMIATVEEARAFVAAARAHGLAEAGVMVEIPSAALLAERLVGVVDFVSLGTNDLAQYTMAADRLVGSLAALNDPWQPALLSLVAHVARAGADGGMPVGVCGEAASDPLLATVLAGLGVTSLSMAPRALAAVGARLGAVTRADCVAAADAALAAPDPGAARSAARLALS